MNHITHMPHMTMNPMGAYAHLPHMSDWSMNTQTLVPMVVTREGNNERAMDIYSLMLKKRIIHVNGGINQDMGQIITASLLYLDAEANDQPIQMYINSPGGSVHAGLAIIDTMNLVKSPVHTLCMGMAASMGAAILAAGEKGHRNVLPNATVMIHSVSAGNQGTIHDMNRSMEHTSNLQKLMIQQLANNCGKTFDEVWNDTTRDYYMIGQQAVDYGIVDGIQLSE